ncbi:hypothetical protein Pmar_PMAR028905 [Perkinsus marinus ATCC 50983]|uniref:Uncharacterized protein n=1 Tax=Perkinsus marinus (strain ATCC 50983 / TXsc) TaxID=423536 RepID=C5LRR9_PERM5|nr:hypothetical protein Pmar_PMAR028905 [Perkinsus marinus ATCC 50983]EER00575.1 hypothetical protein Pmar_PMAR028905 [Perkinsus marinus ATCC 50983]|eukprot:XP_002767857.1 hypothetical protein Pmar_PMAR028905 [Perkinsus marinus ATCC 50983]
MCTCGDGVARKANNRFFVLKFVMIPVVAFGMCFLPNDMFRFLFVTLVPASFIYLLMQQIMLIDLAYSWNESWVQNAELEYSNNETLNRLYHSLINGVYPPWGAATLVGHIRVFCMAISS